MKQIKTYKEFYPYYLSEHENLTCRKLHFIGTFLVLAVLLFVLVTTTYRALWILPFIGYGFAWVGHFFYEKNKPATFKYPLWSLYSDFKMFFGILKGGLKFEKK